MSGGPALLLTPATTSVSVTAAISTAATLTLPAAPAGQFIYLVALEITLFAGAVLTAAATPVLITTTGITGTPTFSLNASAMAQGTVEERIFQFGVGLKGSAAATAMTFVAPLTTNVIWRMNGFYFVGP